MNKKNTSKNSLENNGLNFKPTRWIRNFPFGVDPEVRVGIFGIAFAVFIIVLPSFIALRTARIPYYAISPGGVYVVSQSIGISESTEYPVYPNSTGEFSFVTVRETRKLSPIEWINSRFTEGANIIHIKNRPKGTRDEVDRENLGQIQIRNSQHQAVILAFSLLGIEIGERFDGLEIRSVNECSNALNILQENDTIIAGDGQEILRHSQISDLLDTKVAGELLSLTILRNGEMQEVSFVLGAKNDPCLIQFFNNNAETPENTVDSSDDSAAIGVNLLQIITLETPIDVEFFTGNIRGPSAGLSFALGLLDLLEPGDLTGGKKVASTGTIDANGIVGKIGEVQTKLFAVSRQGYDIFFVPRSQLAEIENSNPSLEVIGVDTIFEALEALEARGGDPLDSYLVPSI